MEVVARALQHPQRLAIVSEGSRYSFEDVVRLSCLVLQKLDITPKSGSNELGPRFGLVASPGVEYVAALWACWLAGGIAVPVAESHPPHEVQYIAEDARLGTLLCAASKGQQLSNLASSGVPTQLVDARELCKVPRGTTGIPKAVLAQLHSPRHCSASHIDRSQACLMVYTSGTTGRPKGAVHTNSSLQAQMDAMLKAWGWTNEDRILHVLPLHHMHGIVNALLTAHCCGACVEFLPRFSPSLVWQHLMREEEAISVFMGVPTMYSYLLSAYDAMSRREKEKARAAAGRLRLTVSGSSALPLPVMQRWEVLSGQRLLERYGMTETGMLLTNPLAGERRPGYVGLPMPGVEARIVNWEEEAGQQPPPATPSTATLHLNRDEGTVIAHKGPGELRVKGPNLFWGYWQRPDATANSFDKDGWFKTGDVVELSGSPPYYRVLGRSSMDIIKSGGYKMSALDIESQLLSHPRIRECAVLGLPHEDLGQQVAAVVACSGSDKVTEEEVEEWARDLLPQYQVPRAFKVVDQIPRNSMGKVNKKELAAAFFPSG